LRTYIQVVSHGAHPDPQAQCLQDKPLWWSSQVLSWSLAKRWWSLLTERWWLVLAQEAVLPPKFHRDYKSSAKQKLQAE
jgi:hypothetical protein